MNVFGRHAWILILCLGTPAWSATLTHTTPADFGLGNGDGHVSITANADGEVTLCHLAGPLGSFSSVTTLPYAMAWCNTFATDQYLYVAGTEDASSTPRADVFRAQFQGNSLGPWVTLPSLPQPAADAGIAVWRNHVYLLGGQYGGPPSYQYTSEVVSTDIQPDGSLSSWRSLGFAPAAMARGYASKGYIFGEAQTSIYSVPILADGSLGTWTTQLTGFNGINWGHQLFGIGEGALWLGGGDNGVAIQPDVYAIPTNSGGTIGTPIDLASSAPLPVPVAWMNTAPASHAGKFYSVGGRTGIYGPWATTAAYSSVFLGSSITPWSLESAALPAPRTDGNVMFSPAGMWYVAGADATPTMVNSVFFSAMSAGSANAHSGSYQNGFDVGQSAWLETLAWTTALPANLSCQVRVAPASMVFGAWSAASSSSPLALNQYGRYVEYRFQFSDPGAGQTLSLNDVTLQYDLGTPTPTPLPSSTPSVSPTPTPSATASPTPDVTPTSTFTPVQSATPGGTVLGDFYIYPSPARGSSATVVYPMQQAGTARFRIYNAAGNLAADFSAAKSAGEQASVLDISGLKGGVFYVLTELQYSDSSQSLHLLKFTVAR